MIFQSCIFYFSSIWGGVTEQLTSSSQEKLEDGVDNRRRELESVLNERWANISTYADSFVQLYEKYENDSDIPLYENDEMQEKYIGDVSGIMVSLLRNSGVNGVYMILNDSAEFVSLNEKLNQKKNGICIRDYDQKSGYTENEDLRYVRGPESVIAYLNCPIEVSWEPQYTFEDESEGEFYYQPLMSAYNDYKYERKEYAYISGVYYLDENEIPVISYSIPLITSKGYPYGVLGVELKTDYIASLFPDGELGDEDESGYMLVDYNEEKDVYNVVAYEGEYINKQFNLDEGITLETASDGFFTEKGEKGEKICGSISYMKISGNVAEDELVNMAVVGVISEKNLYVFQRNIYRNVLFITVIALIVGVIVVYFVSWDFSKPITNLAEKVKTMEPEPKFELDRLGITEIDQLVTSIEDMSKNISEGQARTEFFSRMSHDMRTPMNAIISFSSPEMLKDANEKTKDEYLQKINVSAEYLLGLINEILDMAKFESGKITLCEENISLRKFFNSNKVIVEKLAADKNINFKMNIPDSGTMYILGDYQRLSQIVINLLSNAIKFTNNGGNVTFTFIELGIESGMLKYCMSIKDDGIGMSEEFLNHLYQPFVREDTKNEGTGLGLSITKQLVEFMGGKIECVSKLGQGTEFLVYLQNKIVTGEVEEEKQNEKKKENEAYALTGKNILLCEDHPINRQIAMKLLRSRHLNVEMAKDGKEGFEMFRNSAIGYFDAILMDIRMPNMDGLETTSAIRRLDREDAKTIPIIAMTANAFGEDIQEAKNAGMDAHLSKPIEPEKLFSVLAGYFAKK